MSILQLVLFLLAIIGFSFGFIFLIGALIDGAIFPLCIPSWLFGISFWEFLWSTKDPEPTTHILIGSVLFVLFLFGLFTCIFIYNQERIKNFLSEQFDSW